MNTTTVDLVFVLKLIFMGRFLVDIIIGIGVISLELYLNELYLLLFTGAILRTIQGLQLDVG